VLDRFATACRVRSIGFSRKPSITDAPARFHSHRPSAFSYLPLTTAALLKAAEFWAQARKMGKPGADNAALDGDVILAAQVAVLMDEGAEVVVATSNLRYLSLFVPAAGWQSLN
jgi:hypothetical protein